MTIETRVTHIISQGLEGQKFADEFCEKLKTQGAFVSREEDTLSIIVKSRYTHEVEVEE